LPAHPQLGQQLTEMGIPIPGGGLSLPLPPLPAGGLPPAMCHGAIGAGDAPAADGGGAGPAGSAEHAPYEPGKPRPGAHKPRPKGGDSALLCAANVRILCRPLLLLNFTLCPGRRIGSMPV